MSVRAAIEDDGYESNLRGGAGMRRGRLVSSLEELEDGARERPRFKRRISATLVPRVAGPESDEVRLLLASVLQAASTSFCATAAVEP